MSQYQNALADLEAELIKMEAELEAYSQRSGSSPKYQAFKRVRLNILRNFIAQSANALSDEAARYDQLSKKLAEAQSRIFKLEAACLLHGIGSSIFTYLRMNEATLAALVKKCFAEQWRQMPLEFTEWHPDIKPTQYAKQPLGMEKIMILAKKA